MKTQTRSKSSVLRIGTMNTLTDWIKQHQVAIFFIITFAISWGLGFSYGAVMKQGQFLLAPLVFLATCGPALAGIIVSAICNTQPKQGTKKAYWIAFLVAWAVSVRETRLFPGVLGEDISRTPPSYYDPRLVV